VRSYGAESGLGNPDAAHVLQDGEGFLWLSTLDGLYRFDGERFERFGLESGLPSVQLFSMALDAQGQLLVLTQHGQSRWSEERFAAVPTPGAPAALSNFLVDANVREHPELAERHARAERAGGARRVLRGAAAPGAHRVTAGALKAGGNAAGPLIPRDAGVHGVFV
jgi:hypothetical protein